MTKDAVTNSTSRFSDRVANYVKFRPTYPQGIINVLGEKYKLTAKSVVVDVGSGTGISTELFLRNGNRVYAVEPNTPMREAAENSLKKYDGFFSCNGTSESTMLPDAIADFVVAAQAFHWFEPMATRREFSRILKADGYIVLVWNDRQTSDSAFAREYESLINEFGTDYQRVKHNNIDETRLVQFFGQPFRREVFANEQILDFAGLLGRLASSSYVPRENDARFLPMRDALEQLFNRHQQGGRVTIEYWTKVYICGPLTKAGSQ